MQIRLYEEALLIRMEMCLHRQSLGMMDQRRESILMEKCLLMRSDTVIPSLELRVWNR